MKKNIIKNLGRILFIGLFCLGINIGIVMADEGDAGKITLTKLKVTYENPLSVGSFTELIGNFLVQVQATIGWLAVIMIVIGGIIYITSTGKNSQVELGKKILTFALLGFVIAVAAPSILKELADLASSGEGSSSSDVINQAHEFKQIAGDVLSFVITLIGVIATIGFVISGTLFVLAGGDTSRVEKAKKGLVFSIIGISIAGAALVIVQQILAFMGM